MRWTSWFRICFWSLVGLAALAVALVPVVQSAAADFLFFDAEEIAPETRNDLVTVIFQFIATVSLAIVVFPISRRTTEEGLEEGARYQRLWDAGEIVGSPDLEMEIARLPARLLVTGDWSRLRRVQRTFIRQSLGASIPVLSLRWDPEGDLGRSAKAVIRRHRRFARLPRRGGQLLSRPMLWLIELPQGRSVDDQRRLFESVRGWHELWPNRRVVVLSADPILAPIDDFLLCTDESAISGRGGPSPRPYLERLPEGSGRLSATREVAAPLGVSVGLPLLPLIALTALGFSSGGTPNLIAILGFWVALSSWLLAICWSMWPPRAIGKRRGWVVAVAGGLAMGICYGRFDVIGKEDAALRLWDALGVVATVALVVVLAVRRVPLQAAASRASLAWCGALIGFTWLILGTDQIFVAIGLFAAVVATTQYARMLETLVVLSLAIAVPLSVALYLTPLGATETYGSAPQTALVAGCAIESLLLLRLGVLPIRLRSSGLARACRTLYFGTWMAVCLTAALTLGSMSWKPSTSPYDELPAVILAGALGAAYGVVCVVLTLGGRVSLRVASCALALPAFLAVVATSALWPDTDSNPFVPGAMALFGLLVALALSDYWQGIDRETRVRDGWRAATWIGTTVGLVVIVAPAVGRSLASMSHSSDSASSRFVPTDYGAVQWPKDALSSQSHLLSIFWHFELLWPAFLVCAGMAVGTAASCAWSRYQQIAAARLLSGPNRVDQVKSGSSRWVASISEVRAVAMRLAERITAAGDAGLGSVVPGRRLVAVGLLFGVSLGVDSSLYPTRAFPPLATYETEALLEIAGAIIFALVFTQAWVLRHGPRDLLAVMIALLPFLLNRVDDDRFSFGESVTLLALVALLLGGPSHRFASRRFSRRVEFIICVTVLVVYAPLVGGLLSPEYWFVSFLLLAWLLLFIVVREPAGAPLSYRVAGATRATRRVALVVFISAVLVTLIAEVSVITSRPQLQALEAFMRGESGPKSELVVEPPSSLEVLLEVLQSWWFPLAVGLTLVALLYLWLNLALIVRAAGAPWPFRYSRLRTEMATTYEAEDRAPGRTPVEPDSVQYPN